MKKKERGTYRKYSLLVNDSQDGKRGTFVQSVLDIDKDRE